MGYDVFMKTSLPRAHCSLFGIQEDFTPRELSLDEHFISKKTATFFFEASGDSMAPLIMSGDILIVDRSAKIISGRIYVVNFEGQILCKRYYLKAGQVILKSEDPKFRDIIVTNPEEFSFFGAVTALARHLTHK